MFNYLAHSWYEELDSFRFQGYLRVNECKEANWISNSGNINWKESWEKLC